MTRPQNLEKMLSDEDKKEIEQQTGVNLHHDDHDHHDGARQEGKLRVLVAGGWAGRDLASAEVQSFEINIHSRGDNVIYDNVLIM